MVTDFGLAHWLAQTYKLELNEMNHLKPAHLTAAAYDELKSMFKDYQQSKDKPPQTSELIMLQNIIKLVQKEQSQMSASEKYQADKRFAHKARVDPDDKEWLKDT